MDWTQEEILDYNKKCAEFLGMYDYSKDNEYFDSGVSFCYPEKEKNPGCGYFTILYKTSNDYEGIFNSDWNWIMEVLTKMKPLVCEAEFTNRIGMKLRELDKEAVVNGINQFLIWYNENN